MLPAMFPAAGCARSPVWCVRRTTAMLVAIVQFVLLFAPLTEVHGGDPVGHGPVSVAGRAVDAHVAPARHPAHRHDAATCPACIVRSLHARLESRVPLPAATLEQHALAVPASASFCYSEPPSNNFSRAPPVVS